MAGEKKIDEAWKEATAKEKEARPQETRDLPEVDFKIFMSGRMTEALIALGELDNPVSNKKETSLVHAKFIIDTLSMLEAKTKNNLTGEETEMLSAILYALRMKYVALVNQGVK